MECDGVGRGGKGGGGLQWCLNVCESDFSNEGVSQAMNERACLCGSAGSLFNPFSHFSPLCREERLRPRPCLTEGDESRERGRKANTRRRRDKSLCSFLWLRAKSSRAAIGVFRPGMQGLLSVTRAAQKRLYPFAGGPRLIGGRSSFSVKPVPPREGNWIRNGTLNCY